MKNTMKGKHQYQVTRREFVAGALSAGAAITGAPALLRGQNLNSKLNIAFIGAGGRGRANMSQLLMIPGQEERRRPADPGAGPHPDENAVVLCDVDQNYL